MNRQTVVSSNLWSVGYAPISQTLEIQFRSGAIYQYYGVPQSIYDGLMSAASHGRYHHRFIRNRYSYRRVA